MERGQRLMSQYEGDLEEKKFLGSGGYVYAKLTEQEEIKANLEVAHLFLGSVGRLSEVGFQDITVTNAKRNTLVHL